MTADSVESVSVVGAGTMGDALSRHLLDAGFDVYVCDVDPEPVERLEAAGCLPVDSPAAGAAVADASLILVGSRDQVFDVTTGPSGVLADAPDGHLIAVSSTIAPKDCVAIEDTASSAGVTVVDVPTCRGEKAARAGDLVVFVGADDDAARRIKPMLEAFAAPENVAHVGAVGAGQAAKAANNAMLWMCTVTDHEVLSLAKAYDLDLDALRDVLTRSTADNWPLRNWDWMHTKWAHKDMAVVTEMARERDVSLPMAGVAGELVRELDPERIDETR